MHLGYAWLSEDDPSIQAKLKSAGCEVIHIQNKCVERPKGEHVRTLAQNLDIGDTITTIRLRHLASTYTELVLLLIQLSRKSVRLQSLQESLDTHRYSSKMILKQLFLLSEREYEMANEKSKRSRISPQQQNHASLLKFFFSDPEPAWFPARIHNIIRKVESAEFTKDEASILFNIPLPMLEKNEKFFFDRDVTPSE